jgi:D-threo-aldose 1-dehydrogenase
VSETMTTSRRDFLGIAAAGSVVAASGVFSGGTSAAPADMSQAGGRAGRYVPPVKFGLGGVPLGNEFEVVSDEDAYHTLEAAWNAGVRYYDVARPTGAGNPKVGQEGPESSMSCAISSVE